MSHTAALNRAGLPTLETLTRRILKVWARAAASDIESGARWYDDAGELASSLAPAAGSRERAAVVIAHLSPRTSWARNIATATALINQGPDAARALGAMGDNVERAMAALGSDTPLDTFGKGADKTRSFARNILGDREAVTVDVWAARAAGIDEKALKRIGVYDAVAHAYRLAARRAGVDPATMQATTWIVVRGGRAS